MVRSDRIDALLAEGAQCHARGEFDEAERCYRAALDLAPSSPAAHHLLGLVASQRGRSREGVDRITHAIQLNPGDPDFHANLGSILMASGEVGRADASLRRALALAPSHVDPLYNMGVLHQERHSYPEAATIYRRALAISTPQPGARRNLGLTLQMSGKLHEAVATFRRLVEDMPESNEIRDNLAIALLAAGETREAAELFVDIGKVRSAPDAKPYAATSPFRQVTATKLKHDIEQIDHLARQGKLPESLRTARASYAGLLERVARDADPAAELALDDATARRIEPLFGRFHVVADAPALSESAVNRALGFSDIERRYRESAPEIVVIDDFLAPEALASLRRFCLESTIWGRSFGGGYLGSFMEDGFFPPLLAQIADELRDGLPEIFAGHRLKKAWGFKYDSRLSGINLHADFAAVNVNFWITPDEANRDPASGGLVIWDTPAPLEWGFEEYNQSPARSRAFLETRKAKKITVPYRANRAVVFNSNLFHETDRIAFDDTYEHRRVNITLLYGLRTATGA